MSDTGADVRAAPLAPVVLSELPSRVRDALALLSPLAAVYWRLRWNGSPDLLSADVAALEAAVTAHFGAQVWNTAGALSRRKESPFGILPATDRKLWAQYDALALPVAAYVASTMDAAVSVRRALPEVAPALWAEAEEAAAAFAATYAKAREEMAEAERKWQAEEDARKKRESEQAARFGSLRGSAGAAS